MIDVSVIDAFPLYTFTMVIDNRVIRLYYLSNGSNSNQG